MNIPKNITRNGKKLTFVKAYPYMVMYQDKYGIKQCFTKGEVKQWTRQDIEN